MNDGRVGARPAHNGWNPVLLLPATTLWRWIVLLAGMPPLSHLVYFIARTPAPPVPSPYNAPPPRRSIWLHSWMTPAHHGHVGDGGDEEREDEDYNKDCWSEPDCFHGRKASDSGGGGETEQTSDPHPVFLSTLPSLLWTCA